MEHTNHPTPDYATEALLACYDGRADALQQASCAAQVVILSDALTRLQGELARMAIERARVPA